VARWIQHGMLPALEVGSAHLVRGADLFLLGEVTEPRGQVEVDLEGSQFKARASGNDLSQQWVRFVNRGSSPVDMTGWHVQDRNGATYTFPSFRLGPAAAVHLCTGEGSNTQTHLYWERGSSVWRNEGDVVSLFDRLWNLADRKGYGDSAAS